MATPKKSKRRMGKPFTLYLSPRQASELETVSKSRHVPKSELVRLAFDRFLEDLRGGQLELPIGIDENK
jgi:hypothetical protein